MIIIVKNYGNTINPKHLPHLFDRFYRIDESRTQNNDGVGLGLAITKTIVNAHQGDISVTSENNITSFKLVFPTKRTENSL